jgi:hypothetical protein
MYMHYILLPLAPVEYNLSIPNIAIMWHVLRFMVKLEAENDMEA